MGREAIVVSCSRALEYRPRSTYTSARSSRWKMFCGFSATAFSRYVWASPQLPLSRKPPPKDRKSTRLNSSHSQISYAVFCLKKKNKPSVHNVSPRSLTPSVPRLVDPLVDLQGAVESLSSIVHAATETPPTDRAWSGCALIII